MHKYILVLHQTAENSYDTTSLPSTLMLQTQQVNQSLKKQSKACGSEGILIFSNCLL